MIMQNDLFQHNPPASKNVDPSTSHEAEESVTKSGKRANQALIIHAALLRHGPCTSAELAEIMQPGNREWRYAVARRFSDLCKHKPPMAQRCDKKRKCTVAKSMAFEYQGLEI